MDILAKSLDTNKRTVQSNLYTFNSIADIDLSIVLFILNDIKDKSILNPSISSHITNINGLRNLLLFRKHTNPLSIIIKEEYSDSLDSIYNELMDKYEDVIIDRAELTTAFDFMSLSNNAKGMVINTITCKDKIEEKYAKQLNIKVNIKLNETDMKDYNALFINYSNDLIKFKNIVKKVIYIFNARYNMVEDYLIFKPELMLLSENNIIKVLDPYRGLTIPIMEGLNLWEK